jgi:hypothetical protein
MSAAYSAVPTDFPPDIARRWAKQQRREMRREARRRRWAPYGGHPLRGWRLPVTIVAFILFWPIGLALLGYFFWRPMMACNANNLPSWMAPWKERAREAMERHGRGYAPSGNIAFDEYRESVLKRLEEERKQLDAQQAEFAAYIRNLRRAKDQEEFDRFMADRGTKN